MAENILKLSKMLIRFDGWVTVWLTNFLCYIARANSLHIDNLESAMAGDYLTKIQSPYIGLYNVKRFIEILYSTISICK